MDPRYSYPVKKRKNIGRKYWFPVKKLINVCSKYSHPAKKLENVDPKYTVCVVNALKTSIPNQGLILCKSYKTLAFVGSIPCRVINTEYFLIKETIYLL